MVYPKPIDVLSNCRFGIKLMLFVCFQKHGLHLPYNKIAFELETYFGIKVSHGELCMIVQKMAKLFESKFEELKKEMRKLKVKYVDETGWRINGKNHWLWAFISEKEKIVLYKIDRSRGSKVPKKVLGKKHDGITVNDFYSAYNKFGGKQQKSWVHLMRETSKLSKKDKASEEMKKFHKKVKRLYRDAVRFKQKGPPENEVKRRVKRFLERLDEISNKQYMDEDCQRLAKRLRKHRENMFRFLEVEELRPDNNIAEQGIRPNVVIRKISGGNRSDKGARSHEVMMSIIETYKRRDQNFFEEGMAYIQNQLLTAK
jgi:transposase-like protein